MKLMACLLCVFLCLTAYPQKEKTDPLFATEMARHVDSIAFSLIDGDELPLYLDAVHLDNRFDDSRSIYWDSLNQEYIGRLRFGNFIMLCELYQVNLQGSKKPEIVGFLNFPVHQSSCFVVVLDRTKRKHRLLGIAEFSILRNGNPTIDFRRLYKGKTKDIVVFADLYRSVFYNKGLHVIHTEGDSVKTVFSKATSFNSWSDAEGIVRTETDSAEVSFLDINGDDISEIEVLNWKTVSERPIDEPEGWKHTKSRQRETYYWNQEKRVFVLRK